MSLLAFLGRTAGRERMKVGWCTFMLSFTEALAGSSWYLFSHMYHRMYPTSSTEYPKPSVKYDLQIQTMGPASGFIPVK